MIRLGAPGKRKRLTFCVCALRVLVCVVCACARVCTCARVCVRACVRARVFAYLSIYRSIYLYVYTHTHTHIYICVYLYINRGIWSRLQVPPKGSGLAAIFSQRDGRDDESGTALLAHK